ncbi:DUF2334 domain-containing protein [Paludibaculum fermentans]|uniref:DUF2334 domain-containing protein n=1 Tax=Paludibaculum fermentans TaxID=1473598 RepID=UPI003EB8B340
MESRWTTRYLLRFDDICPTMNWAVWREVEPILLDNGIRPILAVVPDNQDPHLMKGECDAAFWSNVRAWQARGWTIGLHGYQHKYETKAAGIIGRNPYSEFAGLPETEQRRKLAAAFGIFRAQGVGADVWVAPAHSFDTVTVKLLAEFGLHTISDGYSLLPHLGQHETLWVPQQGGRFLPVPCGTWTVCMHFNGWTRKDIAAFRADVLKYRTRISTLPEVVSLNARRPETWHDRLFFQSLRTLRGLRG